MRILLTLLAGLALGAGGATAAWKLTESQPAPSLYTNANGAVALRDPAAHRAAVVQYRGTVTGFRPIAGGALLSMSVDGVEIAAHVYDSTWAPARIGQPLEIQGRIRGVVGDAIDAAGIPTGPPVSVGMTLIDVSAATGPHRLQTQPAAARTSKPVGGRRR